MPMTSNEHCSSFTGVAIHVASYSFHERKENNNYSMMEILHLYTAAEVATNPILFILARQ